MQQNPVLYVEVPHKDPVPCVQVPKQNLVLCVQVPLRDLVVASSIRQDIQNLERITVQHIIILPPENIHDLLPQQNQGLSLQAVGRQVLIKKDPAGVLEVAHIRAVEVVHALQDLQVVLTEVRVLHVLHGRIHLDHHVVPVQGVQVHLADQVLQVEEGKI